MSLRQVAILGSTGSIGVNTLDVIRAHPERFQVVALTAAKQIERLAEQCIEFKPAIAVVADAQGAAKLNQLLQEKQIATQVLPNFFVTGVGVARQQITAHQDKARRTKAALKRTAVDEGLLHRIERAVGVDFFFYGGHLATFGGERQRQAA